MHGLNVVPLLLAGIGVWLFTDAHLAASRSVSCSHSQPGVTRDLLSRRGRRVYRTLRIPEAVFHRVLARFAVALSICSISLRGGGPRAPLHEHGRQHEDKVQVDGFYAHPQ
jgi:hypothetical protein